MDNIEIQNNNGLALNKKCGISRASMVNITANFGFNQNWLTVE